MESDVVLIVAVCCKRFYAAPQELGFILGPSLQSVWTKWKRLGSRAWSNRVKVGQTNLSAEGPKGCTKNEDEYDDEHEDDTLARQEAVKVGQSGALNPENLKLFAPPPCDSTCGRTAVRLRPA